MTDILWLMIAFSGGLFVGWFLLPAPAFMDKWWIGMGWKDRVP